MRTAYVQAATAQRRAELTREIADVVARFGDIIEAQFKAGEISELDARATRGERLIAEAGARAAEHDRTIALVRLRALVGLPQETAVTLTPMQDLAVRELRRSRRVAEGGAGRATGRACRGALRRSRRARAWDWPSAQAVAITAILDANAEGTEGFELGPGFSAELPIFSRNTGGRARASAALLQAAGALSCRSAHAWTRKCARPRAILARARDLVAVWEGEIAQSVEIERRQARLAYEAGELPLFNVIDANRRAVTIRIERSRRAARSAQRRCGTRSSDRQKLCS